MSQEEILRIVQEEGWTDYKTLREKLGISSTGNSALPRQLKALVRKGLLLRFKIPCGRVIFVVPFYNEDQCSDVPVQKVKQ